MAIAIKAIPTLYGEEATRFRMEMERGEQAFDNRPYYDITKDPAFSAMKRMLNRSGMV